MGCNTSTGENSRLLEDRLCLGSLMFLGAFLNGYYNYNRYGRDINYRFLPSFISFNIKWWGMIYCYIFDHHTSKTLGNLMPNRVTYEGFTSECIISYSWAKLVVLK